MQQHLNNVKHTLFSPSLMLGFAVFLFCFFGFMIVSLTKRDITIGSVKDIFPILDTV